MTQNQKRAWGNIIIWGLYLIATFILLINNGTIFFWHDDTVRTILYSITGAAIVAWFVMMLVVLFTKPGNKITSDERDHEIMSRVNAAAGPIAMTVVAVISLVLMIIYLEDKNSVMSPYFLVYITIANVIVYWLSQAVITLIAYRRS